MKSKGLVTYLCRKDAWNTKAHEIFYTHECTSLSQTYPIGSETFKENATYFLATYRHLVLEVNSRQKGQDN